MKITPEAVDRWPAMVRIPFMAVAWAVLIATLLVGTVVSFLAMVLGGHLRPALWIMRRRCIDCGQPARTVAWRVGQPPAYGLRCRDCAAPEGT